MEGYYRSTKCHMIATLLDIWDEMEGGNIALGMSMNKRKHPRGGTRGSDKGTIWHCAKNLSREKTLEQMVQGVWSETISSLQEIMVIKKKKKKPIQFNSYRFTRFWLV